MRPLRIRRNSKARVDLTGPGDGRQESYFSEGRAARPPLPSTGIDRLVDCYERFWAEEAAMELVYLAIPLVFFALCRGLVRMLEHL
jgi:hypothetical protein